MLSMFRIFCPRGAQPAGASAADLLAAGAVLIDVRGGAEFAAGHLEGALSLPLDRIQRDLAAAVPDRNRPLVLYCRSGARSGRACDIVVQMGWRNAINAGGMGALSKALGRPLVEG